MDHVPHDVIEEFRAELERDTQQWMAVATEYSSQQVEADLKAVSELSGMFEERSRDLERLTASPISSAYLCTDSTPVLFFGQIHRAKLVTVGINPSWREFLSTKRTPLANEARRFLHYSERTGDTNADRRVAFYRMLYYFGRAPDVAYWGWFRPVERLANAFGASLSSGTAAHADVVSCFATECIWSRVPDSARAAFTESGWATLIAVLRTATNLQRLVLLGPTALRAFENRSGHTLTPVASALDDLPKLRSFRPALRRGNWFLDGRRIEIIGITPYWNRPLAPLTDDEVHALPSHLYGGRA